MKKRVLTAIVLCVIIVPLLYLGGLFTCLLGALLVGMVAWELLHNLNQKQAYAPIFEWILPVFLGFLTVVSYYWFDYLELVALALLATLLVIALLWGNNKKKTIYSWLLTFCYAMLFIYAISIRFIGDFNNPNSSPIGDLGFLLIAYVYIVTAMVDIFAQVIGTKWGKTKMCPKISPNKTWAGAIGGFAVACIVGSGLYFLLSYIHGSALISFTSNWPSLLVVLFIILLTAFLAFASEVGDLLASKVKRSIGIKDFSQILPGHGGILDRFDSFIISGACFYFIWLLGSLL